MSDRRIVEVEKAPCQHLHSSNYDPAKVVRGRPVERLTNNQMKCFHCGEFFIPELAPRRYTLDRVEQLAHEFGNAYDSGDAPRDLTVSLALSLFFALGTQTREGGGRWLVESMLTMDIRQFRAKWRELRP